ncbi:MAG TPA: peptidylprolyl isomerase [Caulobacteraceae bacterium]|nr:peptidylprolyl isomerase [Caulobacteraceae bacterium]
MRALITAAAFAAALLAPAAAQAQSASDWRPLDLENTLVIETSKGRVVVELSPLAAPNHVARLKQFAREKFYDGHVFHRVINDFMAQTGDPLGTGGGGSQLPDLPGEFTFRRNAATPFTMVTTDKGTSTGFVGSLPVMTRSDDMMYFTAKQEVEAWGAYCPGVAGMARQGPPDTANSQFFLMRGEERVLDKAYTAFGAVVQGLDVVRKLNVGEPPASPDRMLSVRVAADLPEAERPKLMVMDTRSAAFKAVMDQARKTAGEDFDVCDVQLPVQGG